jgi:hypothetical protein
MTTRYVWGVALAVGLAVGGGPPAQACGHCKEDKIAATYDYSVVSSARRNGQTVVFVELHGPIGPASQLDSWIRQQAEAATGVVRGTVRVSLEPAALSFVCDPQAVSTTLHAIRQRIARRGLGLSLIEAQSAPRAKGNARS